MRETLDELGFVGWPKTSGNRGIHVACRIEPKWGFREVRRCALAFAREIERRAPKLVTTAWWKEERGERVFIDYNQNARDRTIASAYSVRARPDATVSAPFRWDELDGLETEDFTMATMPGALRRARRRPGGHRRRRLRPAQAVRVGRARGGGGSRRGAVSAELPEDAGRAEARPAVAREEGRRMSKIDLALVGARVCTLDPERPAAAALAIVDGEIVAVGSDAEIRELGAATETIDLHGAVVVPGLTDSHIHPLQGALDTRGADLRDLSSLEDVRDAVAAERQSCASGPVGARLWARVRRLS